MLRWGLAGTDRVALGHVNYWGGVLGWGLPEQDIAVPGVELSVKWWPCLSQKREKKAALGLLTREDPSFPKMSSWLLGRNLTQA